MPLSRQITVEQKDKFRLDQQGDKTKLSKRNITPKSEENRSEEKGAGDGWFQESRYTITTRVSRQEENTDKYHSVTWSGGEGCYSTVGGEIAVTKSSGPWRVQMAV